MNEDLIYPIAEALLDIDAIHFYPDKPVTWASGLKSPIYCDTRLTISHPEVRQLLIGGFVSAIQSMGKVDVIAGTSTAGIPHAAWVADRLNLPMVYVRNKAKEHGKHNQIEGLIKQGQKVVVVEDLISTGGSSISVIEALKAEGAEVVAVIAVFSYGLHISEERFAQLGIPYFTLTNFETVMDICDLNGVLRIAEIDQLRLWQEDPQAWSDNN